VMVPARRIWPVMYSTVFFDDAILQPALKKNGGRGLRFNLLFEVEPCADSGCWMSTLPRLGLFTREVHCYS
jgi:hypothetical protein